MADLRGIQILGYENLESMGQLTLTVKALLTCLKMRLINH